MSGDSFSLQIQSYRVSSMISTRRLNNKSMEATTSDKTIKGESKSTVKLEPDFHLEK